MGSEQVQQTPVARPVKGDAGCTRNWPDTARSSPAAGMASASLRPRCWPGKAATSPRSRRSGPARRRRGWKRCAPPRRRRARSTSWSTMREPFRRATFSLSMRQPGGAWDLSASSASAAPRGDHCQRHRCGRRAVSARLHLRHGADDQRRRIAPPLRSHRRAPAAPSRRRPRRLRPRNGVMFVLVQFSSRRTRRSGFSWSWTPGDPSRTWLHAAQPRSPDSGGVGGDLNVQNRLRRSSWSQSTPSGTLATSRHIH